MVVDVDVHAADRVDRVREPCEVDVDDVVDVCDAGELLDDLQGQLRSSIRVGGVELVDPVAGDVHLQVARDRQHRDLVRGDAEQDRGVRACTERLVLRAPVGAEDEDRLRLARIGHDEPTLNRFEPSQAPGDLGRVDEDADRGGGRHRDDDQERPGDEAGPQPAPGRALWLVGLDGRRGLLGRRRSLLGRRRGLPGGLLRGGGRCLGGSSVRGGSLLGSGRPLWSGGRRGCLRRGRRGRPRGSRGAGGLLGSVLGRSGAQAGERGLAGSLAIGQRGSVRLDRVLTRPWTVVLAELVGQLLLVQLLLVQLLLELRLVDAVGNAGLAVAPFLVGRGRLLLRARLAARPGRRRRRLWLVGARIAQPPASSSSSLLGAARTPGRPRTKSTIACL
ncbi:MAG: hypothetical protein AUG48_11710 [Actinobacteria bacterium 13_1_20CM_3_68_9]|nr:MAG: hypothetical protein AUG48_11710 [Actinobacteria bacterium 13_1_20CM_3_68_9]